MDKLSDIRQIALRRGTRGTLPNLPGVWVVYSIGRRRGDVQVIAGNRAAEMVLRRRRRASLEIAADAMSVLKSRGLQQCPSLSQPTQASPSHRQPESQPLLC